MNTPTVAMQIIVCKQKWLLWMLVVEWHKFSLPSCWSCAYKICFIQAGQRLANLTEKAECTTVEVNFNDLLDCFACKELLDCAEDVFAIEKISSKLNSFNVPSNCCANKLRGQTRTGCMPRSQMRELRNSFEFDFFSMYATDSVNVASAITAKRRGRARKMTPPTPHSS